MTDILKISTTGLQVCQQSLDTIASNIANVNTPGYSRQLTQTKSLPPISNGDFFVGQGVEVSGVYRVIDQFVIQNLRNQQGNLSNAIAYNQISSQIDDLFSQSSLNISDEISKFFNALHDISNDADSISSRQLCIYQAEILHDRFNDLSHQVINLYSDINYQIENNIAKINSIASKIAELNNQIKNLGNTGINSSPNDLLDMREQFLLDLSECIEVSVVNCSDGTLDVFVASGQSLVMGSHSMTLITQANEFDPTRRDVCLKSDKYIQNINDLIKGGAIGGFLEARESILDFARDGLGLIAMTLSSTINSQHKLGMDLYNAIGGDFFNDINDYTAQLGRALSSTNNLGDAVFSVSINSIEENFKNYKMIYDGNMYTLYSELDLSVVARSTLPSFTIDGISINLEHGTVSKGDSFLIHPTRNGTGEFDVIIHDPKKIAAAFPVQAQASLTNFGSGMIYVSEITNTSGLPVSTPTVLGNAFSINNVLTPPIKIEFISSTVYRIYDYTGGVQGDQIGSDQLYDPFLEENAIFPIENVGSNPTYTYDPGYRVAIKGNPQANDFFLIEYNTNAAFDNRNVIKMINLQFEKTSFNSALNYQECYEKIVSQIGNLDLQSNINMQSSESILEFIRSTRNQISGVNLDEEATKLIQFEQAYQACAQVIAIARNTFDILISAFGR